MTNQEIRQKLLLAGVKNLTEFGYQSVNTESILTDDIIKLRKAYERGRTLEFSNKPALRIAGVSTSFL